jgi:hypothetical protein
VLSFFLFSAPSFAEVYTFLRAATGLFDGAPVSVLTSPSSIANYGESVALNAAGTTLAIGAPTELNDRGAVFVYTDALATGVWILQQKLAGVDCGFTYNENFGHRVALNAAGDTLVITAVYHLGHSGGLRVFLFSGGIWIAQSAILIPPSIHNSPTVGNSLALNDAGDTIAVGGPFDGEQGDDTGAVFTYKRDGSGVWSYVQKLLPSDSVTTSFRYFGSAVAFSATGNTLIIGAKQEGDTGAWWSVQHTLTHTHTHTLPMRNISARLLRAGFPRRSPVFFPFHHSSLALFELSQAL